MKTIVYQGRHPLNNEISMNYSVVIVLGSQKEEQKFCGNIIGGTLPDISSCNYLAQLLSLYIFEEDTCGMWKIPHGINPVNHEHPQIRKSTKHQSL